MTSFAFILGVAPLLFVPSFFVVVQRFAECRKPAAGGGGEVKAANDAVAIATRSSFLTSPERRLAPAGGPVLRC
jgi:hypothetical protein